MRLCEHPEFQDALIETSARCGLAEQFVEKDYYITEILRIISERLPGAAVFKGGTSLSKAGV